MEFEDIAYPGTRQGPAAPSAAIANRRLEMNRRGDEPLPNVSVVPHPAGPGKAEWVRPLQCERPNAILFLHGSGFSKGSPASHRPLVARIAAETGVPVFVPDYRLTPENRFPAALEDALDAYRQLLDLYDPRRVAIIGDSAGGGLVLTLLLAAKDRNLPMPAAAATLSAWTDLAVTGDARPDVDDPVVTQAMLQAAADLYLDGADPKHPYASPLFGDLAGLPPLLMQVGGREIMIEDTRRFAEKAESAGVPVTWTTYSGMAHVFQLNSPEVPETEAALAELTKFLGDAFA